MWLSLTVAWVILIPAQLRQFIPELPEQCKNMKFCEDVLNYPKDYVENIIRNFDHERHELTDDDVLLTPEKTSATQDLSLCKTVKKYIVYPKAAKNKHGDWQFIVNRNKDQTIEVEICAPEAIDKPCGNGVDVIFNTGYLSRCKQKYIYRYMLGLDKRGNVTTIITDMPSCCACVFSHSDDATHHQL